VFVSATLLGFASHAPGGIGVFDAAMLTALWQFDKEHLIAGLLLFRLLYYFIPFALALVILGIRELWFNLSRQPVPGAGQEPSAAAAVAPPLADSDPSQSKVLTLAEPRAREPS
jgi:glycosyltransferase 2 family protein